MFLLIKQKIIREKIERISQKYYRDVSKDAKKEKKKLC